jgi:hypothetical protein
MTQRPPSSAINKFQVFDFNEVEAEQGVKVLHTMNGNSINPNKPRSPISKYAFLQACKSLISFNSVSFFFNFDPFFLIFVHSLILIRSCELSEA